MTTLADPALWQRVMVIAPHPDDESLATGGLLSRASARGASLRILHLTDGENNPWPQRLTLRRWRITEADRTRWGALRRAEVRSAIRRLGVPDGAVHRLALPDQGLTALALRGADILHDVVAGFRPTLLVTPAARDLHPDHSATAVMAARALARLDPRARPLWLGYVVHGKADGTMRIALDARERMDKRAAILCHASQLPLSRRRFLAHVKDFEVFTDDPLANPPTHPVLDAIVDGRVLRLWLAPPLREAMVLVTSGAAGVPGLRCTLRPAADGEATVAIDALLPAAHVFIKVERRWPFLIFDRAGWHTVNRSRGGAFIGASKSPVALESRFA